MKFLRLNLVGLDETDQAIYIEQLREHWRLDAWAVPGQFIALIALMPVILRSGLSWWVWLPAIALLLATWSWGSLSQWRLRRVHIDPENYPHWRRITLLREVTQGLGWGALGALLWGALPAQWHLLILSGLIVYTYTAVFFSTHDLGVAVATSTPILSILMLRLLTDAQEGTATIALILGLSMVTCLVVGRLIEGRLLEGERLRRRNEQLVADLAAEVENVRTAKEWAEAANRQKSEFIAAASHDLRQPLHSLTLMGGLLEQSLHDQPQASAARTLNHSVASLRMIFEQLFDIARVDAEKLPHRPQVCRVEDLLGSLPHEFKVLCDERGLQWSTTQHRIQPNTGAWADALFVQRILRNCLENSLRYTPVGGRVSLRVTQRGTHLVFQVWDSGVGIGRADRSRIFEDYTQLHNPARQLQQGLGLGLGLVRRLLSASGDRMTVRSRLGQGSCFSLWLTATPVGQSAALPQPSQPQPGGAPRQVLLIEDDPMVRAATEQVLSDMGWTCFSGPDATSAINALSQADGWPDLVLTDFRLGASENGLEVVARCRHEFGLTLPALLLTGDLSEDIEKQCKAQGVALARKPLPADVLHSTLQSLLRPLT